MDIKEERGANSQLDMSRPGGKIDALKVVVMKVERGGSSSRVWLR